MNWSLFLSNFTENSARMDQQIIVSEKAMKAAEDCRKGFSCFEHFPGRMCKVIICLECKMYGILCEDDHECNFRYAADGRRNVVSNGNQGGAGT